MARDDLRADIDRIRPELTRPKPVKRDRDDDDVEERPTTTTTPKITSSPKRMSMAVARQLSLDHSPLSSSLPSNPSSPKAQSRIPMATVSLPVATTLNKDNQSSSTPSIERPAYEPHLIPDLPGAFINHMTGWTRGLLNDDEKQIVNLLYRNKYDVALMTFLMEKVSYRGEEMPRPNLL